MRVQETGWGITALVLLAMFPGGFMTMDYFVPSNGHVRNIVGFSLFSLPLLSFILSIKSRHTWMGIVGLVVSVPLSCFVIGATVWVVNYSLRPH